jgi:hypothetical protein
MILALLNVLWWSAAAAETQPLKISIAPRAQFESELPNRPSRTFVREAQLQAGLWNPEGARLSAVVPNAPAFTRAAGLPVFSLQLREAVWETQGKLGLGLVFGAQARFLERSASGNTQSLQLWAAPIGLEASYLPFARGPRLNVRGQALPTLGLLERSPISDRSSLSGVGSLVTLGLSQSLLPGQSLSASYEFQTLRLNGGSFSGQGIALGWIAALE